MIKATMLLYRAPHLSRAQFLEYWGQSHAALAKKHATGINMRRYVQVHPVDNPLVAQIAAGRGCIAGDFDAITEAWWDSFETMAALGDTAEEVAAALLADELSFLDMKRCVLWFGEEREVMPLTE